MSKKTKSIKKSRFIRPAYYFCIKKICNGVQFLRVFPTFYIAQLRILEPHFDRLAKDNVTCVIAERFKVN